MERYCDEEFQVILSEMESYRTHKSLIRRKVRNEFSNEREEEIRDEAEEKRYSERSGNGL